MCGICGFTGEIQDRDNIIKNMAKVITHRGPDSEGFFNDDYISMGFRRLSIIDLDSGHQPIFNEDKSLVINFNGEIYNYKDIRKELIAAAGALLSDNTYKEIKSINTHATKDICDMCERLVQQKTLKNDL